MFGHLILIPLCNLFQTVHLAFPIDFFFSEYTQGAFTNEQETVAPHWRMWICLKVKCFWAEHLLKYIATPCRLFWRACGEDTGGIIGAVWRMRGWGQGDESGIHKSTVLHWFRAALGVRGAPTSTSTPTARGRGEWAAPLALTYWSYCWGIVHCPGGGVTRRPSRRLPCVCRCACVSAVGRGLWDPVPGWGTQESVLDFWLARICILPILLR